MPRYCTRRALCEFRSNPPRLQVDFGDICGQRSATLPVELFRFLRPRGRLLGAESMRLKKRHVRDDTHEVQLCHTHGAVAPSRRVRTTLGLEAPVTYTSEGPNASGSRQSPVKAALHHCVYFASAIRSQKNGDEFRPPLGSRCLHTLWPQRAHGVAERPYGIEQRHRPLLDTLRPSNRNLAGDHFRRCHETPHRLDSSSHC